MTQIRDLARDLRPMSRPARLLYGGAAFWLVAGLFHIGALAMDGWQWSGSISFRKPIVFSVSIGLLLGSVGWVIDRLPERPRLEGALAWTLLASATLEVGLIALQTWRGRASHFNVFEGGDALIFAVMGVMIGLVSLCLVVVLVWSLIERPADPLVRFAVIGGLLLVMTGLGIGQWIIELGNEFVARNGTVPETVTYGESGAAKFPHAVAFHGIQVFIVAAVALQRVRLPSASRRRLMRTVFWAYAAGLVFASVQTVLGQGPLQPSVWSLGLVVSLLTLAVVFARVARALAGASHLDREPALTVG
jgi:hypothetical protein